MLIFHRATLQLILGAALTGGAFAATPISGITDFGTASTLAVSATGSAAGAGLLASNVFGYDFRLITKTASPVTLYVEDLAYQQGNGIDYFPANNVPVVSMISFGGSANNGDIFDMKGVDMTLTDMTGTATAISVVMTGYRNGIAVSGATSTLNFALQSGATTQMAHFDVSANTAFQGIDEFRLSPGAGSEIGYFDNLNATNFQAAPEASAFALLGSFALLTGLRRRR
jgi:hypothetical protein